jgi:precorrin-4/cobalt-precorrin-4 C11-methyltransferase
MDHGRRNRVGKVVFIGAGPGDPQLITLKGKKNLEKADIVIYAGLLLNPEILKYAKPDVELHDSAGMNLKEVLKVMMKAVKEGKLVARVHDGDPSFFDARARRPRAPDSQS